MDKARKKFVVGIVGGMCPAAVADISLKIALRTPQAGLDSNHCDVQVASDPAQDVRGTELAEDAEFYDTTHRMLYVYQVAKMLEFRGADIVVVPDFITHTALGVLRKGIKTPLLDLVEALAESTREDYPDARRIGILTTTHCLQHDIFGPQFQRFGLEPVYPSAEIQKDCVMEALYGKEGLRRGYGSQKALELLSRAVQHLLDNQVDAVAFGVTELPLQQRTQLPAAHYIDCNDAAARMLVRRMQLPADCASEHGGAGDEKRIGILGGLGPAATVDLFGKIVKATAAKQDQDHAKIVIENNPSVPDRTRALLHGGEDPSVALLASARRLEASGVSLIVCPCNTAHAFLGKIQKHIQTPLLFMPEAVAAHISSRHPAVKKVGLLATDGSIQSRVYANVLERSGLETIIPGEAAQKDVMEAIYGKAGIKAGNTEGPPRQLLKHAAENLVAQGAGLIILGCTEIPLALKPEDAAVPLIDATQILADSAVRELARLSGNN